MINLSRVTSLANVSLQNKFSRTHQPPMVTMIELLHLLDVRRNARGADEEVVWDEQDERERLMESGQHGPHDDSHYHDNQDEHDSRESFELVKSKPNDNDNGDEGAHTSQNYISTRGSSLEIETSRANGSSHLQEGGQDEHDRHDDIATTRPKPTGLQAKSGIILVSGCLDPEQGK